MVLDDSESEPVFEIECFVSTDSVAWCSNCCEDYLCWFSDVVTDMFDDKYWDLLQH